MAYSDFTLPAVKRQFNLTIDEADDLFPEALRAQISPLLQETLRENVPLALAVNTEKVRSELIIAPVLVELRRRLDRQISLFSGVDFTVDSSQALNGVCDFIISRSPEQLYITAPVVIIFEAKNENIKGGLGQCIAAMVAARLFNEREGTGLTSVYGVVTTGTNWRFLRLQDDQAQIDRREYYLSELETIMGILVSIIGFEEAFLQPV